MEPRAAWTSAGHSWLTKQSGGWGFLLAQRSGFAFCFISPEREGMAGAGRLSDGAMLMPTQYPNQGVLSAPGVGLWRLPGLLVLQMFR